MPITDNKFRLSVDLDAENAVVRVKVIDREKDEVVEQEAFDSSGVHDNVRQMVGLYGLSKLLQDRSSETPAGPAKLQAMKEVFELLSRGEWERERKAGAPVVSVEVEALAELKQISVAQAQTALRKFTKEQREKILTNPKIVEIAARLKAERDQPEADIGDLLGEESSTGSEAA